LSFGLTLSTFNWIKHFPSPIMQRLPLLLFNLFLLVRGKQWRIERHKGNLRQTGSRKEGRKTETNGRQKKTENTWQHSGLSQLKERAGACSKPHS